MRGPYGFVVVALEVTVGMLYVQLVTVTVCVSLVEIVVTVVVETVVSQGFDRIGIATG